MTVAEKQLSKFDEVMKKEHLNPDWPRECLRSVLQEMDKEHLCDARYILEKLQTVTSCIEDLKERRGGLMTQVPEYD